MFKKLICAAALACLCAGLQAQERVLYAKDYIKSGAPDAVPGVLALVKAAKEQKATKIIFEKQVYQLYDDRAFEKYLSITNHDSGLKKIALPLFDFHDLEIDGGGATFMMHGLIVPICIEDSDNIRIRNLTINWYRPLHSELVVEAVDSVKKTVDFRIAPEYPYEIRNRQLVFLKKGYEHNIDQAIYWDNKTNAVAFQNNLYVPIFRLNKSIVQSKPNEEASPYPVDPVDPAYRYRGAEPSISATQLKPGLVRISGVAPNMPKPGWVLVAKGLNGYNRMAPAIRVAQAKNLTITDVTVNHAGGMAFVAEDSEDIHLNGFRVLPDPNDHRMLSTTADATHFSGCRGKILMENCVFQKQLDDATNIHGMYVQVADVQGNVAGINIGHFQQTGNSFGHPGDQVVAVNPEVSAVPIADLTIRSVEQVSGRYYKVTFDKDVPAAVVPGLYLENTDAYPEVVIRNNNFTNNRARGLLISTPKPVLIEGNTFSNMMSAVLSPNEFSFWYESGYVGDLTIRNNTFLDGAYGTAKPQPLINLLAVSKKGDYIHGNLVVENNTFRTYSSSLLFVEHGKNVVFRNNRISYSGTYPINFENPVVDLENVGTAVIENNQYDPLFKVFLAPDMKVKQLKAKNNKAVKP
ncbi:MAG: Alpha-galactosidase, family [Sphingobacteriaceae bacterium]|jgi:hypothetical protein|nr:Alpha-galactosidase, family [Sphingobacteriaceae bacterium]